MGRREAPLDASAGVIGKFAAGLRDLRIKVGQPTYRQLARSSHFSAATLARAASGRSLPSLEVTLAYVTACGGNTTEWRRRWEDARRLSEKPGAHGPATAGGTTPEPDQPRTADRTATEAAAQEPPPPALVFGLTRWRHLRHWLKVTAPAVAVLSLAANVGLLYRLSSRPAEAKTPPAAVGIEDGTDPKASHCDDARNLDIQSVTLRQPTRIGDRQIPAAALIGTVSLRFSPRCAGAWARFDPAPNLFADPSQGTVTVQASRPAEGAQATWRLGHIDQTYSDLLLTGMGCVQAHVVVNVLDGNATAEGTTSCLPKM